MTSMPPLAMISWFFCSASSMAWFSASQGFFFNDTEPCDVFAIVAICVKLVPLSRSARMSSEGRVFFRPIYLPRDRARCKPAVTRSLTRMNDLSRRRRS